MTGPPSAAEQELCTVRLLGFPLALQARAEEHFSELRREFTFVADPNAPSSSVPERLLAVAASLEERFAAFTAAPRAQREAAARRGERSVDLEFRVPAEVREAALTLDGLLEEADEYARKGDLLTLAAPEDVVDFRRWYLREFVNQIDGSPPTPFSDAVAARS